MIDNIGEETCAVLLNTKINVQHRSAPVNTPLYEEVEVIENGDTKASKTAKAKTTVGRNEPCPCGSGKKYKNCCGK